MTTRTSCVHLILTLHLIVGERVASVGTLMSTSKYEATFEGASTINYTLKSEIILPCHKP